MGKEISVDLSNSELMCWLFGCYNIEDDDDDEEDDYDEYYD